MHSVHLSVRNTNAGTMQGRLTQPRLNCLAYGVAAEPPVNDTTVEHPGPHVTRLKPGLCEINNHVLA